jgi:N-acetylglucosamine-6-phosphate deacetylase
MNFKGGNTMTQKILLNAGLVTPFHLRQGSAVAIEGNKIREISAAGGVLKYPKNSRVHDLSGKYVLPGFIDLHVHGIGGNDFSDPGSCDFESAAKIFLRHGVTGILVTLTPKPQKELIRAVRFYSRLFSGMKKPNIFCGLHLEGPFLNRKMHGAINPDYIWDPDFEGWCSLYEASQGYLKLMTIAPELPGALEIIRDASLRGVATSLGHTEADYESILAAVDNGLAQVTHIYNAMHPTHHRDPGVLGACYTSDELKVQLIADGIHVHPVTMKFLARIKGANGILLVSDAIAPATNPDGKYEFCGQEIHIKDNRAFLGDGTLAGSCITLDYAVRTMVKEVEIPLTGAARMASLNPARVLRKDNTCGIISAGKEADLVVMNADLEVEATFFQGELLEFK